MKNIKYINMRQVSLLLAGHRDAIKGTRLSRENREKLKLLDEKIEEWKQQIKKNPD